MRPLISEFRKGFRNGYNGVLSSERDSDFQMDFGIRVFSENEVYEQTLDQSIPEESVWVLMKGKAEIKLSDPLSGQTQLQTIERQSLFDEPPSAIHLSPNQEWSLKSLSENTEFSVVKTKNLKSFTSRVFLPRDIQPEYRGKGLVQEACIRNVRLIFDREACPDSNLVIGEVINYPGRWSSYPPHHHDQPEIYHYRFTEEQGYGHSEVGDDVYKVFNRDTVKIPGGQDHGQCSAPGYGMYYLWIVRHLEGNPYTGFEYSPEHRWTLDPNQQGWTPKDVKL